MSVLSRFLARIAPINSGDFTLQHIAEAVTSPGELFDVIAREDDDYSAWGRVLDPDATPSVALGWLAQFAGVRLLPSDTEADQRARIKAAAGFKRGTPQAMINEVTPTLTGTQYVNLIQQAGGARWAMTLVTRPAETPSAALTYAAALRQKPAGINLTHVQTNDVLWVEATKTWAGVAGGITWANLASGDV